MAGTSYVMARIIVKGMKRSMVKITFMGAGSTVFARNVLGDCMCTPALRDAEIALYDIDAVRLEESAIILNAINKNINEQRATIKTYLGVENRKEALRGANFVVNAIQVGFYDPCTIIDFEVPKKYGLRQTIADTLGIGGIMRALRTIPVMRDFARYGGGLSRRVVPQLHQPHGDADRLYAAVHEDQNGRFVPQRAGLLRRPAARAGHGG